MSYNSTRIDTSIVKHEATAKDKPEFYTIEPDNYPDFPVDFAISSVTTEDIAKLINAFFKPVLSDYAGCRIGVVAGPGRVYYADSISGPDIINTAVGKLGLKPGVYFVELCFRDNKPIKDASGRGPIKSLKATNIVANNENTTIDPDNPASNLCNRIMVQNRMSSIARTGNSYEIDQKTTQVLEAFRFRGTNPVRWTDLKIETVESINNSTSRSEILVGISGLDMHAIISTIYGTNDPSDTDDTGDTSRDRRFNKYEYKIEPINFTFDNFVKGKCVFHIIRMDTDVVSRVRSDLGLHVINNVRMYNC